MIFSLHLSQNFEFMLVGNKRTLLWWVHNTTSLEETNQPIAPCQEDLDMKACKEELVHMRRMIGSSHFGLCILFMKDKSLFNTVDSVSWGV